MNHCGVVSLSQLHETGRWDAFFNLAYQEHREAVIKLLELTRADVIKLYDNQGTEAEYDREIRNLLAVHASVFPFDEEAAKVRKGSGYTERDFLRWDAQELALYLVILSGTIDAKAAEIRAEAQRKIDAIDEGVRWLKNIGKESGND